MRATAYIEQKFLGQHLCYDRGSPIFLRFFSTKSPSFLTYKTYAVPEICG